MAWNADDVELGDLVRTLSPETIEYFRGVELGEGYGPKQRTDLFKFVRMGHVIGLGLLIPFGPEERDYRGRLSRCDVQHIAMMEFVFSSLSPAERVVVDAEVASEAGLPEGYGNDAGRAVLVPQRGNNGWELALISHSMMLGQAPQENRQRTIEMARAELGNAVLVTGTY